MARDRTAEQSGTRAQYKAFQVIGGISRNEKNNGVRQSKSGAHAFGPLSQQLDTGQSAHIDGQPRMWVRHGNIRCIVTTAFENAHFVALVLARLKPRTRSIDRNNGPYARFLPVTGSGFRRPQSSAQNTPKSLALPLADFPKLNTALQADPMYGNRGTTAFVEAHLFVVVLVLFFVAGLALDENTTVESRFRPFGFDGTHLGALGSTFCHAWKKTYRIDKRTQRSLVHIA